jgi:multisubunit Na+/H+ antiporter MnhE subunit
MMSFDMRKSESDLELGRTPEKDQKRLTSKTLEKQGRYAMRRFCSIAVIGALLLASSAFAGEKKSAFKVASSAIASAENSAVLVVPITIEYDADLTALDIPLKYSEGVTLTEVKLGEMLNDYDFKVANIDAEKNQVIIGAIHMVYGGKAELSAGSGVVAELHFRVDDPTLESIRVEAIQLEEPNHDLYFVYNQYDENNVPHVVVQTPEFAPIEVALSGTPTESILPKEFALNQNYPNPFNPKTNIGYALPSAGHVTVEVFNVLGQRVTTLVDENQEAGNYLVEWDATDADGAKVSSGVYFYKLNAGDVFVKTQKMVLLK